MAMMRQRHAQWGFEVNVHLSSSVNGTVITTQYKYTNIIVTELQRPHVLLNMVEHDRS